MAVYTSDVSLLRGPLEEGAPWLPQAQRRGDHRGKPWEVENPWENPWENHQNMGKTLGKSPEHGKIYETSMASMGKSLANANPMENHDGT